MQPSQTMVGPIAKQCLEGLGWPPSLWSLETLENAGIILGFNRSRTPPPPHHPRVYTLTHCACTDTHTLTLKDAQSRSSLIPILLRSDATPAAQAHFSTRLTAKTHQTVSDSSSAMMMTHLHLQPMFSAQR